MKKIVIVILFSLIGLGGAYFFHSFSQVSPPPTMQGQVVQGVQEHLVDEEFVPGKPSSIRIPSLGVDTAVEHVAEDAQGRMDVPREVFNTAWYEPGVRPGELGNAVIAGHFDTPTGDPSVFYELDTLVRGDEIQVEDVGGNTYIFEVADVVSYPTSAFPIQEVFGTHDTARLNLITCGGIYDQTARDYLERVVVFSELVSVEKG